MLQATGLAPVQDAPAALPEAQFARLLAVRAVDKSFGTTRAVQGVDFEVRAAEIVALMGGNGAGKSTLMKIVGGLLPADAGEIELFGRRLGEGHSPAAAMALGLRFVHQELSLCANLRVFENFAVELPDMLRGLRWKALAIDFAREALADVFPGNGIDPRAKVGALSLSQRQMVEIARSAGHPATRLLILDEPTSSLGSREAEQLRAFIKRRRTEGVSFVFISHRLHESLDVADRMTVMRNGRVAWTGDRRSISHGDLVELLGGRQTDEAAREAAPASERAPVVRVTDLRAGALRGVSLAAARGEILGLAGLEGSGQREVLRAVFEGTSGEVAVDGRVAFVSGDRARRRHFPALVDRREHRRLELRAAGAPRADLARALRRADLGMVPAAEDPGAVRRRAVTALSGGNQQKAVIARALAAEADVLLLDDPTRGVDLGTKADLYRLFRNLAAEGRTILWYSTDDSEFAHCDRTLVMRDGAIAA